MKSKTGQNVKLTFKDGLLYVKGQVVVPTQYALLDEQPKQLGECLALAAQENGLNDEQQDALVKRAMQLAIAENTTGNHNPRNHFVKAKNPYGHH